MMVGTVLIEHTKPKTLMKALFGIGFKKLHKIAIDIEENLSKFGNEEIRKFLFARRFSSPQK